MENGPLIPISESHETGTSITDFRRFLGIVEEEARVAGFDKAVKAVEDSVKKAMKVVLTDPRPAALTQLVFVVMALKKLIQTMDVGSDVEAAAEALADRLLSHV
jgi:hypothetical protein